jgi:hypothetical protein
MLAANLMTLSQIPVPDAARELAEVWAVRSLLRAVTGELGSS